MKKILLLGGSHRDIPLINAAKDLGFYVFTLGDRVYYRGHDYSNQFIKEDFNNLEKIREIIKNENIDFLLPGCGEESYLNTVRLSHEFNIGNFDNLETAKLIHNKWKFKDFCLKHNISTPKGLFYRDKTDLEKLNLPVVVKPTTLSGGRGVQVARNKQELDIALKQSKKLCNEVFLEEYIEGKLVAYSIFIENQKIIYEFFAEDKSYLNKYLISTAYTIKININTKEKLKNDVEILCEKLNLVNGMFHLQVLIRNDIPYIIDVTRRIAGDFFPYLIEHSDDVQYSQAVVKAYTTGIIGKEFNNKTDNNKQKFIIRHCAMPNKNGIYQNLHIDESIKDKVFYRFDLVEKGYEISNYLNAQISILLIKLDEIDNMIIDEINSLIEVEVN